MSLWLLGLGYVLFALGVVISYLFWKDVLFWKYWCGAPEYATCLSPTVGAIPPFPHQSMYIAALAFFVLGMTAVFVGIGCVLLAVANSVGQLRLGFYAFGIGIGITLFSFFYSGAAISPDPVFFGYPMPWLIHHSCNYCSQWWLKVYDLLPSGFVSDIIIWTGISDLVLIRLFGNRKFSHRHQLPTSESWSTTVVKAIPIMTGLLVVLAATSLIGVAVGDQVNTPYVSLSGSLDLSFASSYSIFQAFLILLGLLTILSSRFGRLRASLVTVGVGFLATYLTRYLPFWSECCVGPHGLLFGFPFGWYGIAYETRPVQVIHGMLLKQFCVDIALWAFAVGFLYLTLKHYRLRGS